MCLQIKLNRKYIDCEKAFKSVLKTTKKDIKVYKVLCKEKSKYYSPFQAKRYYLNSHYYQTGYKFTYFLAHSSVKNSSILFVEEGLHAYTNINKCIDYCGLGYVIVSCTIPKGSQYILGNNHDIVTDNLIIGDRVIKHIF